MVKEEVTFCSIVTALILIACTTVAALVSVQEAAAQNNTSKFSNLTKAAGSVNKTTITITEGRSIITITNPSPIR